MKKDFSQQKKTGKIALEVLIILLAIVIGMFGPRYFPGTEFEVIINQTLGKFFDLGTLISTNYLKIFETATIFFFIWVINKLVEWSLAIFLGKKAEQSAAIILFKSTAKYAIGFFGGVLVLGAWGIDSSTLLVSFGLIGFAVSFAAQGLIQDFLAGVLIILEGQYKVDDVVYIDGFRGKVLSINLRTTKFLDMSNLDIKYVQNRDIKDVINASQRSSISICDLSISYDADLIHIEDIIKEHLPILANKYKDVIQDIEYLGVQQLADSAVILRVKAVTKEETKYSLQRTLNREFKLLFDRHFIEIPFPQVTVHQAEE